MKLYGEVWPGTVLCFYPGTVVSHSGCQFQTYDILIGRGDGAYIGEGREGASIGSGYFFSPNELYTGKLEILPVILKIWWLGSQKGITKISLHFIAMHTCMYGRSKYS